MKTHQNRTGLHITKNTRIRSQAHPDPWRGGWLSSKQRRRDSLKISGVRARLQTQPHGHIKHAQSLRDYREGLGSARTALRWQRWLLEERLLAKVRVLVTMWSLWFTFCFCSEVLAWCHPDVGDKAGKRAEEGIKSGILHTHGDYQSKKTHGRQFTFTSVKYPLCTKPLQPFQGRFPTGTGRRTAFHQADSGHSKHLQ